ncbi:MAG: PilZ domain-containing protein [Candidatus Endonucleobacter bathymodioli]|uniref:PilZ domain-containing protein n=1 Tax=Candidatus Endonucleibacter bathymodioli TaxID=539814 RepID=A0AA90NZ14_9GAMM|nr:PilZ domain-containing protein [Candidatus Endonucleobacter bathymodioli]
MSIVPHGKENHPIKRCQLSSYLKVYNRNTLREMGSVCNISGNGLMLVSFIPVLIGAIYNMRIVIPDDDGGQVFLDFDARCHWCKPDVGPDFFDSGYSIISDSYGIINLVEALKEYFSFNN